MNNIAEIENVFYINLESRTDRKALVERELTTIGISNPIRFNAVKLTDPRIGCSMSHMKCLAKAKEMNWPYVLIVEDDIQFLNPTMFVTQFNSFLSKHNNWDVILLAGNNMPPYKRVDDTCIKVRRCQTTTGYVVNGHYFDTLIKNIKESMIHLMREPANHLNYAIDKYWFQLQEKDDWYLITPLTVVQREGYSDVEKKHTNFVRLMTDIDKEDLIQEAIRKQMKLNNITPYP